MNHGLSLEAVARIGSIFHRHPEVERAILYGSRAKGNFRPGSDIDLALDGKGLNRQLLDRIAGELDDLLLPWRIDLALLPEITHAGLLDHIQRVGVKFYQRAVEASAAPR